MWWTAAGATGALVFLWWWVWRKGRPFAAGDVFRASRLSAGNRLFPTQVLISPTTVVQYTPRWVGREEESIHMAHVASVKIDTHVLLSDVLIETSGGVRSDSLPRPPEGRRGADESAHRPLSERVLSE